MTDLEVVIIWFGHYFKLVSKASTLTCTRVVGFFSLAHVTSANMEGYRVRVRVRVGTYDLYCSQIIEIIWIHFWRAVMTSIFNTVNGIA